MPQQVQKQQLGVVCPVPLGEYNPQTAYQKLNIVTYNESTYIAKIGNQGITPLVTDGWETYWMKIAAGEGITSTNVAFQIGDSGTVPPVGEWSSEQIKPVPGKYLWTKVTIVYTNLTSKEILFPTYGGEDAGFGTISAQAETLSPEQDATASVKESGDNKAKNLEFSFGIPRGKDAGFGDVTAEAEGLDAGEAPTVQVEVSGEDTKKNFSFKFGLPKSSPFDYDSLTPEQQAALNSGITSDKVLKIGENEQAIARESSRAIAEEQENANAIKAEKARAEGVEGGLDTRVTEIENKIPPEASADNPLETRNFINSSINALAAFYITSNKEGEAFPTKAALTSAETFYQGGKTRVPSQNDYAIVLSDESKQKGADGSYPTTRYSYQGGIFPNGQWEFQYIVNNTSLTAAQIAALNSGITSTGVAQINTNKNDISSIKAKNTEQDTAINNAQSRANVSVRYDISQSLTDTQKRQARQNIGAGDSGFSGSYTDLTNKPSAVLYTSQSLSSTQKQQARTNIGAGTSNFSGNYNDLTNKPSLAGVATSGSYTDLTNKPSLAEVATSGSYTDLTNKPSAVLYTSQSLSSVQQQQARTNIGAGTSNFSGNYNDLTNKPSAYSLPTATETVLGGVKSSTTGTTINRNYNVQVNSDGTMKVNVPWTDTHSWTSITGKPSWVNSSTKPSYSWSDIGDKPEIVEKTDLDDYVTTNTQQTISASKTITGAFQVADSAKTNVLTIGPTNLLLNTYSGSSATSYSLKIPKKNGTFALLEDLYPVGSVYISYTNTSPGTIVGGSWTPITGRFPYFNAGTSTGGSNTVTLTVNQIPAHSHIGRVRWTNDSTSGTGPYSGGTRLNIATGYGNYYSEYFIADTGGGAAHDNMPAYQTFYAWRRTA